MLNWQCFCSCQHRFCELSVIVILRAFCGVLFNWSLSQPTCLHLLKQVLYHRLLRSFSDPFTSRICTYVFMLPRFYHALSLSCKKLFMHSRSVAEICSRGFSCARAYFNQIYGELSAAVVWKIGNFICD